MSNIPVIDIIFFFLIVLMVIHGYVKGFIEELFSWAAPVLAIVTAVLMFPYGAAFIRERFMENVRVVPELLAFIAIFVLVMMVVKFLGRILKDVITGIHLGAVNKLFGAIFGLAEGLALTAIILFVLSVQPVCDASKILADSMFAGFLFPIIQIPLNRRNEVIDVVLIFSKGVLNV